MRIVHPGVRSLCAGSEANAAVGGIEDRVVVLEELLADDEVDIGRGAATITNPRVGVRGAQSVVRARNTILEVGRKAHSSRLTIELRGRGTERESEGKKQTRS